MKRQVRVMLKHKKFLDKIMKRNYKLKHNFIFKQQYIKILKQLKEWGYLK